MCAYTCSGSTLVMCCSELCLLRIAILCTVTVLLSHTYIVILNLKNSSFYNM